MKRIVILISGRGSNMRALVQACQRERWPARVVAVISNRPDAPGLEVAAQHGVVTEVVDHQAYATRDAFDEALGRALDAHAPDLVVLAGFMRILGLALTQRYQGRMLNIHPSLLPAFAGLHTHRRALQAGCSVAGATVHFVTAALDQGPIVIQSVVPILPDDDEERLAARVLKTEHQICARAVRWFLQGDIVLQGDRVLHRHGQPRHWFAA